MPNIGTVVRLADGRIAVVSEITPDGTGDEVLFENGHSEHVDQCESIAEMLTDEPPTPHELLLAYLRGRIGVTP